MRIRRRTRRSLTPTTATDDNGAAFLEDLFARGEEFLEKSPYRGIVDAPAFFSKIVGVTFEGRQSIVGTLRAGDELALVREPENAYDANAVAVHYGELKLGFLKRALAEQLAPVIDAGRHYDVSVASVTGGDARSVGINVRLSHRAVSRDLPAVDVAARAAGIDRAAIQRALIGERSLHRAQTMLIERVFSATRTLGVLGTGRGKSLCFQLPAALAALERDEKTLVLYPLRALANDQFEAMCRKLGAFGLRLYRANGAISSEERHDLDAALETGAWDIILSTPEFVQFHGERFLQPFNRPALVVVDEAHHVFEATHRPAYGRIGEFLACLRPPNVLALTATASTECFRELRRALAIEHWVIDPTVRDNLSLVDARNTKDKQAYIRGNIGETGKAIIYCNSRTEATKVAEGLRATLPATAFYHAGMGSSERGEVERLFREGGVRVVVATSAFGEGIDLPDVRDVFLYHLNFSFTEFNQQAGRAGRDGAPARIHLLYGESDRRINDFIIAKSAPSENVLREIYREMRKIAGDAGIVRMTYTDIARMLDIDRVDDATISVAAHIFADAGLAEIGIDDDGRFVRFMTHPPKVDIKAIPLFAEGMAERDDFDSFCHLALGANVADLERIVNRPIYPDDVALVA